jgi:hypothetical protein
MFPLLYTHRERERERERERHRDVCWDNNSGWFRGRELFTLKKVISRITKLKAASSRELVLKERMTSWQWSCVKRRVPVANTSIMEKCRLERLGKGLGKAWERLADMVKSGPALFPASEGASVK